MERSNNINKTLVDLGDIIINISDFESAELIMDTTSGEFNHRTLICFKNGNKRYFHQGVIVKLREVMSEFILV